MAGGGKGCLKFGLIGCGGIIVLGALMGGISALIAWRGVNREVVEEQTLSPDLPGPAREAAAGAAVAAAADPDVATRTGRPVGRVVLDVGQGEFRLRPSDPGEGTFVEATFDRNAYTLEERFTEDSDSTWTYEVRFHRKGSRSGLTALFAELMGASDPEMDIYLSPDVPIELVLSVEEGGLEAEIGGLWITSADVRFEKGGLILSIDEPLRQPMTALVISGEMGGVQGVRLGNASPSELDVSCRMGGGEIDLTGEWLNSATVDLHARMGGIEVTVPRDMDVEGVSVRPPRIREGDEEIERFALRIHTTASMGEIEVQRD